MKVYLFFFRCIEFFLQSNPQMSINQLYNETYGQFILADLSEIAISTLPEALQTKTEQWSLTGKFTLQMQYLLDICKYDSRNFDHFVNDNRGK
jgi:RecQ-mediated genome instability protein 1